ncbi:carboxylesterase [Colletotrichum karsti]|uniref:Carboxylic ester hydrolase n=1 Tax=Colletotrichum karsti TaxID=1095194 RepID=A0A9P6HTC2_9PEZI|nr:carboxylesterase [Colletotrichum karsti]KAF9869272.1 carboxylesterase [Colletotrichum karsti]
MQFRTSHALAALSALGNLVIQDSYAFPSSAIVETENGAVSGFADTSAPSVTQFLGIPYGEPPVGSQRWLPAQPKKAFGSLKATARRPSCPQTDPPTLGGAWAPEFLIKPNTTSEDCLYLNVWAPSNSQQESSGLLPVVVWIHGGGFGAGSNDIAYQTPTQWVERSQRHIVVGINYRLGLFGFPNAAGLDPKEQNLGLLDQRLAVEWVRDNIARFGGDPKRVVLWGQSAGAASVSYYQYAYSEDPVAIGFIKNSGSPFIPIGTADTTHSSFSSLAAAFGCQGADELDCLRNVPFRDLQKYLDRAGNLTFNVVVDERTKFSDYAERTLDGKVAKGPAIVGSTRDEWNFNSNSPPPPSDGSDVHADNLFGCPAHYETGLRNIAGLKSYRYMYSSNFSNIMPGGQGAFHSAELPLIFGTHDIARENSTQFEYDVSHEMQDLWLAFVQDPVDGLTDSGWDATPLGGLNTTQTGIDIDKDTHPRITSQLQNQMNMNNKKIPETIPNSKDITNNTTEATQPLSPEDKARKWILFYDILVQHVPKHLHVMCCRIMLDLAPEFGMEPEVNKSESITESEMEAVEVEKPENPDD